MRIVVMDTGLRSQTGHHDHFVRGLSHTLGELGIRFDCLAASNVSPELQRDVGAVPLFRAHHYTWLSSDPYDRLVEDFRRRVQMFEADLERQTIGTLKDDDMILMPTAASAEIFSLLRWCKRHGIRPKIACIVHQQSQLANLDLVTWGQLLALWRDVYRQAKDWPEDRLWIGGMTGSLARRLEPVLDRRVHAVESIQWVKSQPRPPTRPPGQRMRVGLLGAQRYDKGDALIRDLIQEVQLNPTPIHLVIQAPGQSLEPQTEGSAEIEHLTGWTPDDALERLIGELDLIALPYVRSAYRQSGLFALAAPLGRPMVVPSRTWMAERITSGFAAGVIYEGERPQDVLEAILKAQDNLEALTALALERAGPWRASYSGDGLVRSLVKWFASPG